jgi:hypothetical protein
MKVRRSGPLIAASAACIAARLVQQPDQIEVRGGLQGENA